MTTKRRKLSHHSFVTTIASPCDAHENNLSQCDNRVAAFNDRRSSSILAHTETIADKSSAETDSCPICLQEIHDIALALPCSHTFDFDCLRRWTEISQSCPMCKGHVRQIIHNFRGINHDKYIPESKDISLAGLRSTGEIRRRQRQEEQHRQFRRRNRGTRETIESEFLHLENDTALQRRKYVYDHDLTASHVGANKHSNFASFTAHDFAENHRNLKSRTAMFLRRELQVFTFLAGNREFTLQYILTGILTHLHIQSPSALKLVGDVVGQENARILLHELRTFLRSPYEDLRSFDRSSLLQYQKELLPRWPEQMSLREK